MHPPTQAVPAVAFDFDGTLTSTDTTKLLVAALLRAWPLRALVLAPLVLRLPSRRRAPQELKTAAISRLVRGTSERAVQCALGRFVTSVAGVLRPDLYARLRQHSRRGDLVIVATASPAFAVRPVFAAESLEIVGTEFEVQAGRYTGRSLGNCYGEEKARRVRAFIESRGLARLEWAYSDHHSDAPLLALARHAVLVKPGPLDYETAEPSDNGTTAQRDTGPRTTKPPAPAP